MVQNTEITPEAKIGNLLEKYPQLEEVLLSMSPAFAKLKNPVLRRTVAKVATLKQVARVDNIPLGKLVNTLRNAIGEDFAAISEDDAINTTPRPDWFDNSKIKETFDARPMIDSGEQPLGRIFGILNKLKAGEIFELTTPFVPAPIIEMAENKAFRSWTAMESSEICKTYILKG